MSTLATFTIDEYEHMISCGAFAGPNEKRLELIRGELRMMSPLGAAHAELVAQLNDWSHEAVDRQRVKIRIQSSIAVRHMQTQPEPDLVWAEAKSYARRHPRPSEVLLLVEVADSSLTFDLGEKCGLYCEAGIRDYWVVDIPNRLLHVFRDPQPGGYQTRLRLGASEEIAPLLADRALLPVTRLFACLAD